jgi:hypothetical protein
VIQFFAAPASAAFPAEHAFAFMRKDGSDTAGDGSPARPFATWQRGIDAGFECFDFGVADPTFGDGTFPGGSRSVILRGKGHSRSLLGMLYNRAPGSGASLELHLMGVALAGFDNTPLPNPVSQELGFTPGPVTVYGDVGSVLGNSFNDGGTGGPGVPDLGDGAAVSGPGGAGGPVNLQGPFSVGMISRVGGAPGADAGGGQGSTGSDGEPMQAGRGVCVSVPPMPDSIVPSGATINGTFYANSYP